MNSLPDEILLLIFQNLIYHCEPKRWRARTQKLQPLSLVCRRFHEICNPLLYAHIQGSMWYTSPTWMALAKSLQQNTELARYIRKFETCPLPEGCGEKAPSDIRLNLMFFWDVITDQFRVKDLWALEKKSHIEGDNILLAFILLQATNVEELNLQLETRAWVDNDHGYRVIRSPRHLPLALEEFGRAIYADSKAGFCRYNSLRTLKIDLTNWYAFHCETILPFLSLPNLQTLRLGGWRGFGTQDQDRSDADRNWPIRTSSVHDLYLYNVLHAPLTVLTLLRACKTITHFGYVLNIPVVYEPPTPPRIRRIPKWRKALTEALHLHADSLEHLVLSSYNVLQSDYGRVEHFNRLRKLRYLDIPYERLVGNGQAWCVMQLLPPSLKYLTIRFGLDQLDTSDNIDSVIEQISRDIYDAHSNRDSTIARPKAVELMLCAEVMNFKTLQHRRYSLPAFDIENIRSLLRNHGVHLDVSLSFDYSGSQENDKFPATVPTMRALKRVFPGFVRWCQGHEKLKASTTCEPYIKRDEIITQVWPWNPYGWLWKPWDWENEEQFSQAEDK